MSPLRKALINTLEVLETNQLMYFSEHLQIRHIPKHCTECQPYLLSTLEWMHVLI